MLSTLVSREWDQLLCMRVTSQADYAQSVMEGTRALGSLLVDRTLHRIMEIIQVFINKYKYINKQSRTSILPFCMNVGIKLEGLISLEIPQSHTYCCSGHNSKGMVQHRWPPTDGQWKCDIHTVELCPAMRKNEIYRKIDESRQ